VVARRLFVNLESTEKTYVKGSSPMCPRDGFVVFRNSELLCGRLGKVTLGGGNKAGLFQVQSSYVGGSDCPGLALKLRAERSWTDVG
jgi:hypothetical protein